MRDSTGRAGCGCLIMTLVVFLVLAAAAMHPFSLRLLAGRLIYKDAIVTSDAILVPYFPEDKNGELFMDAFREFWAGNGKTILVEEQRVIGLSLTELVKNLARERGIREPVIKKIAVDAGPSSSAVRLQEKIGGLRLGKVIVIVPDYASRRFHEEFGRKSEGNTLYLIRPVAVSYFAKDRWWKNAVTRRILIDEIFGNLSLYLGGFTSRKDKY